MRTDEQEIEGPSDSIPWSAKEKAAYEKRSLQSILDDVASNDASNYNRIPVDYRDPTVELPWVDPSPYQLFSIFITPQMLELIATFTNIKADRWWRDPTKKKSHSTRPWEDTDGAEIGAWIGVRLLMGLEKAPTYQSYWNTNYTGAIYIAIQGAMTVRRFEQIRRFLKINDPREEPENIGAESDFWQKVEPFVEGFREGCLKYYRPGSHVSVDEFLVKYKGRSRHTMNIAAKAGGKGFKIYGISCGDYLIDLLFTSKVSLASFNISLHRTKSIQKTKVSELKTTVQLGFPRELNFSSSCRVVIQLIQRLPNLPYRYHLFTDNFFTTQKCMEALRTLFVAHSGTCKAASGYPNQLLAIRQKAKKKAHWGVKAWMCINDRILCLCWVDNNAVQYMTTGHKPERIQDVYWLDPKKRSGIPPKSWLAIPEEDRKSPRIRWATGLPVPWIIHEYNMHMNGVDRVAQMVHEYADERRNLRYWVALFVFIIHASTVNAFRIHYIRYKNEKSMQQKHSSFQRSIALELIRRSHNHRRQEPKSQVVGQDTWQAEHHWEKLSSRKRCKPCKDRRASRPTNKRKALGEISANPTKKPKVCIPQVIWQCSKCKTPCCRRNRECWRWLHLLHNREEDRFAAHNEDCGQN